MLFFRNVNIASTHHSTRWATLRPGCMWFVVSCSLGAYIKACWWMDGCWFSAWWIWRCTLMVTIDTVLLNSTPVCYYGMAQHLPPLLSSISRKVLKAQRCSHLRCDVLWMTNSCSWPRAEANKWERLRCISNNVWLWQGDGDLSRWHTETWKFEDLFTK